MHRLLSVRPMHLCLPQRMGPESGARLAIRLLLSGDLDRIFACEDIWRCSECRACSRACPMEIDIAGILSKLRKLELANGFQRCAEREATDIAIKHLSKRRRINTLLFAMSMAARGFLPRDIRAGALGLVGGYVGKLAHRRARKTEGMNEKRIDGAGLKRSPMPLFAGCMVRQDGGSYKRILATASALAIPLEVVGSGTCCGHPTRGAKEPELSGTGEIVTVCPGCQSSLANAGIKAKPLWEVFVNEARAKRRRLATATDGFVPYVGCMGERDQALSSLAAAADLAGVRLHLAYPSLHAVCCGALGSIYRRDTRAAIQLLDFAAERQVPVVTTCLLCRDNLLSAARRLHSPVRVYFWPHYFCVEEESLRRRRRMSMSEHRTNPYAVIADPRFRESPANRKDIRKRVLDDPRMHDHREGFLSCLQCGLLHVGLPGGSFHRLQPPRNSPEGPRWRSLVAGGRFRMALLLLLHLS